MAARARDSGQKLMQSLTDLSSFKSRRRHDDTDAGPNAACGMCDVAYVGEMRREGVKVRVG